MSNVLPYYFLISTTSYGRQNAQRQSAFLNFYFKNMHICMIFKRLESVSPTFSCKCLFERGGTEKHCLTVVYLMFRSILQHT